MQMIIRQNLSFGSVPPALWTGNHWLNLAKLERGKQVVQTTQNPDSKK